MLSLVYTEAMFICLVYCCNYTITKFRVIIYNVIAAVKLDKLIQSGKMLLDSQYFHRNTTVLWCLLVKTHGTKPLLKQLFYVNFPFVI